MPVELRTTYEGEMPPEVHAALVQQLKDEAYSKNPKLVMVGTYFHPIIPDDPNMPRSYEVVASFAERANDEPARATDV